MENSLPISLADGGVEPQLVASVPFHGSLTLGPEAIAFLIRSDYPNKHHPFNVDTKDDLILKTSSNSINRAGRRLD